MLGQVGAWPLQDAAFISQSVALNMISTATLIRGGEGGGGFTAFCAEGFYFADTGIGISVFIVLESRFRIFRVHTHFVLLY